ncbi:DUF6662 family protein [Hydrogenovibrio kuenenii]|uniref:DUF6662 family protein n=1 Tax=Hydrogenovibrio kuenenii TaxID=63658 RepID=UPI00046639A9|nr:DUF6662 family protein [Hydrogenovibrio kuenenii]
MQGKPLNNSLALYSILIGLPSLGFLNTALAGEQLLGYTQGAEPLPKGASEFYQIFTTRNDKGKGTYHALDSKTEIEHGFTNRFSGSFAITGHQINTNGLLIDGYLPQEKNKSFSFSGMEAEMKYAFLTPALNDIGLSTTFGLSYDTVDSHSGQKKDTLSADVGVQLQKYFMDGQLVWLNNASMESTYAKRPAITGINDESVWPTTPEMEIELTASTGISYRFTNNWSIGTEAVYQTEFETEVGQERWSLFAGPSIHYGDQKFWATLTYLPQVVGGGERYPGQSRGLHLIEKTKYETKLKLGYNF